MALVMLAATLALGTWQVQRLAWKQALLAEIDRGEMRAPVALPDRPEPFSRVFVEGRFLSQVAFYGADVRPAAGVPQMGARLIAPLERSGAVPVLVDRGWAPLGFDPAPPTGLVRVEGYVRPPEPHVRFGAADDPAARRFYALDPAAIGPALGLQSVAPFTIVALGPATAMPQPAAMLPRPPNNHLIYAITWFGLSAALLVVYGLFLRQSLLPPSRQPSRSAAP